MRIEKFDLASPKYIVRYPDNYKEGERYPVIFFLHGAGTRGDSLDKVVKNVFIGITEKIKDFPFITVAPLCSRDTWFDHFEELSRLYVSITGRDFTDPERVYIVGVSMGGYAAWQLAMSKPEYTAAIIPICGGGMYWNVDRLKDVPVWAHHGEMDNVVLPEESKKMVNRLNALGGDATLTIYDGVAHASWIPAFHNPDLYQWLLSHKCKGTPRVRSDYVGNQYG